jgi:hypothetical protein
MLLLIALAASNPAWGQSARDSEPKGLDASEYFGESQRDALSEILESSRGTDPNESAPSDPSLRRREDDRKESSLSDKNELSPDEPTTALGDAEGESESEEDDEATQKRKAMIAKQRALVGYLRKLHKPVSEIHVGRANLEARTEPVNQAVQLTSHLQPQWVTNTHTAPRVSERYPVGFCHRPLYFQQVDLERCGDHHGCLQNAISAGHFLYGVAVLPYRLASQCPDTLVKSPGDCRSGQTFSAPLEPLRHHGKDGTGILGQAAALAGFSFLLL